MSPSTDPDRAELARLQRILFAPGAEPDRADFDRYQALRDTILAQSPMAELMRPTAEGEASPAANTATDASDPTQADEAPHGFLSRLTEVPARKRLVPLLVGVAAVGVVVSAILIGQSLASPRPFATAKLESVEVAELPSALQEWTSPDMTIEVARDVWTVPIYFVSDGQGACLFVTDAEELAGTCGQNATSLAWDFFPDAPNEMSSPEIGEDEYTRVVYKDGTVSLWRDPPNDREAY